MGYEQRPNPNCDARCTIARGKKKGDIQATLSCDKPTCPLVQTGTLPYTKTVHFMRVNGQPVVISEEYADNVAMGAALELGDMCATETAKQN